jgi:hypothetical protein
MNELVKKMVMSDVWILLTINEKEPDSYVFDADFSKNLTREEVDKTIIDLAKQLEIKDQNTNGYNIGKKKSRCCGRCDGIEDICVSNMVCDNHLVEGCEICYGEE